MPIYEYRCNNCRRRISVLVRGLSPPSPVNCTACGSQDVSRIFSSFAIRKSDQSVYEDILSDSRLVRGMEGNDPRALAEWSRRMGQGVDDVGPEYKEMIERLEAGERVEDVMARTQEAWGEGEEE